MKKLLKQKGNRIINICDSLYVKLKHYLLFRCRLFDSYAPNAYMTYKSFDDQRDSEKRLAAIESYLPKEMALTCMDIGCNLGYFTFNMAKRGAYCLGIDYGKQEIKGARNIADYNNVDNVAFSQYEITKDNACKFPKFDVVICLSVYHHWVRKDGVDTADEIMTKLAASSSKYFIFDTGQPDEENVTWANELKFMGDDIDSWGKRYFENLGFSKVENLGTFSASVSTIKRHLFIATR
ncbi:MAG: class I SAM-dependent methyltransferase [Lentisphaeraceae bacterium]|nr:class I SAM-dependent methyltransferase [Lentisphaeraceae bacterium]